MKKIVPANPGIVIRTCGCMGNDSPSGIYCDHTETFDQVVVAWIIYTDEHAIEKEAEGEMYVEPVTILHAMEHIQSSSGIHSKVLINGFEAEPTYIDGFIQQ
jgi:hypothetical protein